MRCKTNARLLGFLAAGIVLPMTGWAAPALAQPRTISVAAMPLAQALKDIQQQTGTPVAFDPDAVAGKTSQPVRGASNARQAVDEAIKGADLAVVGNNGRLTVISAIIVIAHRDQAETSVLVNQSSTSDRLGQSLREQARNTEVISSKLLEEQQAQNIQDALRNAGDVTVSAVNVQSGTQFSVRGFSSAGVTNGLSSPSGVTAGVTEPIANIERIEVLKGPDAILSGVDNLGGTINIVTKKPSADPLTTFTLEGGSYGHVLGTIDANTPLTSNGLFSARMIASGATESHNYGGYTGDKNYLLAPSVRFKNATTDIILSAAATKQIEGMTPYVILNPVTLQPYNTDLSDPLFTKDQKITVSSNTLYGEVTQKLTDWVKFIGRAQHQTLDLDLALYSNYAVLDPSTPLLLLDNDHLRQEGRVDSFDTYLRFDKSFGPIENKLAVGYTHVDDFTKYFSNTNGSFFVYPLFSGDPLPPIPTDVNHEDDTVRGTQSGEYAQYLLTAWKRIHLSAGVRHNHFTSTVVIFFPSGSRSSAEPDTATSWNFGAVLDLSRAVSLFASDVNGFSPNYALTAAGDRLPNITTKNLEAGIKAELLRNRLFVTASYFQLKQSSVALSDPQHPGFYLPGPGQMGKGIDISASGQLARGLTVQSSFSARSCCSLSRRGSGSVTFSISPGTGLTSSEGSRRSRRPTPRTATLLGFR